MIAIDLCKQHVLDAHPKAIQQIKITGNLQQNPGATMLFIIEEAWETVLDSLQETVRVLRMSS